MVNVADALCCGSLAMLGYATVGYPASLLLHRRVRGSAQNDAAENTYSILIAARNEAATLGPKIEALLAQSDARLRELVVVDDASTDATSAVVSAYADERIVLLRLSEQGGKSAALARGLAHTTGNIIVFSDVRQELGPGALQQLVSDCGEQQTVVASARLSTRTARGPGLYWRYEAAIRDLESATGSVPGATGAFYAARRDRVVPPPEGILLDDVWIPLHAARNGGRIRVSDAEIFDTEATHDGEFARKARTLAGNFQLLAAAPWLLLPWANPLFGRFVGHKVVRLMLPFVLLSLLASNVFGLAGNGTVLLHATSLTAWATIASVALVARKISLGRLGNICRMFMELQVATLVGLARFLRKDFAWTSARSTLKHSS